MKKPRITQAHLQRLAAATNVLLSVFHKARVEYAAHLASMQESRKAPRTSKLSALSRYLTHLLRLPAGIDYGVYEAQLKRRIIRANHRVFGCTRGPAAPGEKKRRCGDFSMLHQLGTDHLKICDDFGRQVDVFMRLLADVEGREVKLVGFKSIQRPPTPFELSISSQPYSYARRGLPV